MKNFVQPGDNIEVVAPYAVSSGQGLLDGSEFSVAATDIANGAAGIGVTRGVFTLPKAAVAVTRKTVAYWDNTARLVTNVATSNTKIGIFQASAASGDAAVAVKLVTAI
jgi:predicted RecA/RadA family phage recombinase